MFLKKKPRREILVIQLTALIDIFSMLIIFLIKGSVFGVALVEEPTEISLPASHTQESLEIAPQLKIHSNIVTLANTPYRLEWFNPESPSFSQVQKRIKSLPKGNGLVNLFADKDTPYSEIYKVVKAMNLGGFQNVQFIAIGSEK